MKKNKNSDEALNQKFESIKDFFPSDEEFFEAIDDVFIFEKLKKPTKYSTEIENIEGEISKLIQTKNKLEFQVLLINYKRYLFKHFLVYQKEQESRILKNELRFDKLLNENKKDN